RHALDGVIVSNTTLSRAGLTDRQASQAGGMSGQPLFRRSTVQLARMRQRLAPGIPLIGVGGVHSADTAYEKIRAGASLVQVYTGLIFEGLGLVETVKQGLVERLAREGFASIGEAVGTETGEWAREAIE